LQCFEAIRLYSADNNTEQSTIRSEEYARENLERTKSRTYDRHRDVLINASSFTIDTRSRTRMCFFLLLRPANAPPELRRAARMLHESPRWHRNAYTPDAPRCMAICDGRKGGSSSARLGDPDVVLPSGRLHVCVCEEGVLTGGWYRPESQLFSAANGEASRAF
jgi:hypothetical protein